MPPFFRPVASISSLSELPSYPRLLKIGAAASTIFRRVCSPLVIALPIFQSDETARSLPILPPQPYGCSRRPNGLTRCEQIVLEKMRPNGLIGNPNAQKDFRM